MKVRITSGSPSIGAALAWGADRWGRRTAACSQTISLRFFSGRTLILLEAGRAATSINSPGLNGLGTPLRALRALRAGTFRRWIFSG